LGSDVISLTYSANKIRSRNKDIGEQIELDKSFKKSKDFAASTNGSDITYTNNCGINERGVSLSQGRIYVEY
jgi:hypothetical protein